MRVCVANKDIVRAMELFAAYVNSKHLQFSSKDMTVYDGTGVCGGVVPQGSSHVTFFLNVSDDGLEDAMRQVSIPQAGTFTLHNTSAEAVHSVLVQRTGVDISHKPRYFLHEGLLEVIVKEGRTVLLWWGDADVTTHALAVATKLKGAVRRC